MRKTPVFIFLLSLIGSAAMAQNNVTPGEQLTPLGYNPAQAAEAMRYASHRMAALTDTIPFPNSGGIRDNFSYDSHRPDTSLWDVTLNPGVFINRGWAIAPPDLGVCTFDGLDCFGQPYLAGASTTSTGPCDVLTSRPIDLSAKTPADSVYFSFWYQPQGRGYFPNTADSLILEFNIPAWNPNSSTIIWKTAWFKEGYNPGSDSSFRIAMIKLDSASYFVKGFKFRFRNYGTQCGSNDHWHLDEVFMKDQRTKNDTLLKNVDFAYESSSALANYWAVPYKHYNSSMMATNFNVWIRNNDTIATGRSVTYNHRVFDETGAMLYQIASPPTFPCLSYDSIGYMNYAPISHPAIGFAFPDAAVNADSTTFVIQHIIGAGQDHDTMVQTQRFYNYYAYDDGEAEAGYSLFSANSSLAVQYKNERNTADELKAIEIYFLPVQNTNNLILRDWNLVIWANDGPLGMPGTILYRQRNQHVDYNYETPDRFVTYTIDSGTVWMQPGQVFYIGWQQLAPDKMFLGFDYSVDHHDKVYYNTTGSWNQSIFFGSLMMRPVFEDAYDVSGVHENTNATNFSIYPNPANDQLTIDVPEDGNTHLVSVLDLSGREVIAAQPLSANGTISVAALSAGVYFVQLRNEQGELEGTQRLVIAR